MESDKAPTEKQLLLSYLDQVLSFEASKLVGKTLKRFEIINNNDLLKKEVKELVYESFRDLRDIFEAYAKGIEVSVFTFKNKEK